MPDAQLALVEPSLERLSDYADALQRGWSSDTTRDEARFDELESIANDPATFISVLRDAYAKKPPLRLPDGSYVPRLPGFRRWMWDGEFAGSIGLRWQEGTPLLPPWCFGHIGYGVVPWKRRRGYATAALALMLPEARAVGLPYVLVTTTADNVPSQCVILANGGVFIEHFDLGSAHEEGDGMRYRIDL